MFDPESFLDQADRGAMADKYTPLAEGDYVGQITDVAAAALGAAGSPALQITWQISEPEEAQVRQTLWLDLNPSGAGLDKGPNKNIKLGQLRTAVGQNDSSMDWTPRMLVGAVARIKVSIRVDKEDPTKQYNDVKAVAKL